MSSRKVSQGNISLQPLSSSHSITEDKGAPEAEMEGDHVSLLGGQQEMGQSEEDKAGDGEVFMSKARQDEVVMKVSWNILPITFLMTFVCFVDRTNLGLAADSFCHDLGITSSQYGTGVGLLFIGESMWRSTAVLLSIDSCAVIVNCMDEGECGQQT